MNQYTYGHHGKACFLFLGLGLYLYARFEVMFDILIIRKSHDNVDVRITLF